ncbi:MAG TPA: hypothetical protein VN641_07695 [Urbifossiella sp.]|nr:hypothetical protein [Urbifossiella sp.]
MANTNTDPKPSMSAAELRRRLLATTPAPVDEPEPAEPIGNGLAVTSWGSSNDLLSRLRMPGGGQFSPSAISLPAARVITPPPAENGSGIPQRSNIARRTPAPTGRLNTIDSGSAIAGALNTIASISDTSRMAADDSPMAEIQRLRAENKELKHLLHDMKPLLEEANAIEQNGSEKQQQYEEMIRERDAQIEELNAHLGTIEEQIAKGELAPPPPVPKTRGELEEWSDELEKESAKLTQERKRLEEERRQLHEDEEGLEKQMRDMEVSMARERAMLARQETELKRLSAEIQHEVDILQRGDAGLREQMVKFQRRAQEVMSKPSNAGRR